MQLPVLSSLQWWIAGALLASAFVLGSTIGYNGGIIVQKSRDVDTMKQAVDAANSERDAAIAGRKAQADQYAKERHDAEEAKKLADQLFNDLRQHASDTDAKLNDLRKQIDKAKKNEATRDVLATRVPSDVRRSMCAARGETCP